LKKGLSKSRIISGLQCPKRLYLETFHRDLITVDEGLEQLFATGHAVGAIAQDDYPDGVLIQHDTELGKALEETQQYVALDPMPPVYEATFSHEGVLIRVDVLTRHGEDFCLTEVKASTSVKSYHKADCAIQKWVMDKAGFPVRRVQLGHVNRDFVYETEHDYRGLVQYEDITQDVFELQDTVQSWVDNSREILSGDTPDIAPGAHCKKPFECPFLSHCAGPVEGYPISTLKLGARKTREIIDAGFTDVRDIPAGYLPQDVAQRIWRATVSGEPYLDPMASEIVSSLPYPRYYLDFETIGNAIPIWLGTRPYQAVPFQWSCHIEHAGGSVDHKEFLDISGALPTLELTETLLSALDDAGPVLVYTRYEENMLNTLKALHPEFSPAIDAVIDRIFDLYEIAKKYYYHRDMMGSWSLKRVLPTIVPEMDYALLEGVQHGVEAQQGYLECVNPETEHSRREELRQAMLVYCKHDTQALVEIARYFATGVL